METYLGMHALEGEWHSLLPRYLVLAGRLQGLRVLEIGCGAGLGTAILCALGGADVTAIDHRAESIQSARGRFPELEDRFRLQLYESMESESGSYDVVLSLNDDFPINDRALLEEVRRVLRPGGTFVGAWAEPGSYGLDRVLPRLGDSVQGHLSESELRSTDTHEVLAQVFPEVLCVEQEPELCYLFRTALRRAASGEGQETTAEFDMGSARREQAALAAGDAGSSVDLELLTRSEGRRVGFHIAFCADTREGATRLGIGSAVRVPLPYFGVAERLGRILTELYRHLDDLSQSSLLLEGQLEEKARLIDDLEEEVRSHRELTRDQAAQLERYKVELDTREPDLRPADLDRRIVEARAAIEERDAYIDHLAASVRRWEQHSAMLQRELEAREAALADLRRALEQRPALPAPTAAAAAVAAAPSPAVEGAEDAEERAALLALLERQLEASRSEARGLEQELITAARAMAAEQDRFTRSAAELAERRVQVRRLEARIKAQDDEARAFADEVGAIMERANNNEVQLGKAQEELEKLRGDKAREKESFSNLEVEIAVRGQKILKLERELMGKNIEITSQERENVQLVKALSERDARMQELRDELRTLRAAHDDLRHEADEAARERDAALAADAARHRADAEPTEAPPAPGSSPPDATTDTADTNPVEIGAAVEVGLAVAKASTPADSSTEPLAPLEAATLMATKKTKTEDPKATEATPTETPATTKSKGGKGKKAAEAAVAEVPAPAVEAPAAPAATKGKGARGKKAAEAAAPAVEVVATVEAPAPAAAEAPAAPAAAKGKGGKGKKAAEAAAPAVEAPAPAAEEPAAPAAAKGKGGKGKKAAEAAVAEAPAAPAKGKKGGKAKATEAAAVTVEAPAPAPAAAETPAPAKGKGKKAKDAAAEAPAATVEAPAPAAETPAPAKARGKKAKDAAPAAEAPAPAAAEAPAKGKGKKAKT